MNYTFRSAASISSISQDFLDVSIKIANREINLNDSVNYLTNIEGFYSNDEIANAREWLDKIGILDDKKSRCSFIGSLSNVFDWDCVIEAFKNSKTELLIAGDGPCFQDLKEKTKNQSNIFMLGRITAVQSKVVAERTNVFIAPYKYNLEFSHSLPNKFFDAMQYGKPLLSSVTGTASQFLVQKNIGLVYSDVYTLEQALEKMETNPMQIQRMGQAALDVYNKDFSGHIVYGKMVKMLEVLAKTND
jgi:glycosyltransferase involved in cell wall biosynthesis